MFRPHYLNVERMVEERWNFTGFYDKKVYTFSLGRKWPVDRSKIKRSRRR
ncbi:hypothetical protein D922_03573 [Enterococcus faecalis 06-MB-DW-09]|nr:hypothetical protein D922_03573 [Enterococcus faecalis 06-MB-DW-09]